MNNIDIINKVTTLLDLQGADFEMLNLQTEIVKQKILNHCNRADIPQALELIIVEIVSKQYKNMKPTDRMAESIKRGDTEIKYAVEKTFGNVLEDYKALLAPFVIKSGAKVRFL